MKLLLAEDNPQDRHLFCRAVADLAQVVETDDGQDAIERFTIGGYDAIVLDDAMPGLTGFEAAKAIRQQDPAVPIIIWSGRPNEVAELMARDVNASFVSKHQPISELVDAIRAAVG